jgi:hypothetical protein
MITITVRQALLKKIQLEAFKGNNDYKKLEALCGEYRKAIGQDYNLDARWQNYFSSSPQLSRKRWGK